MQKIMPGEIAGGELKVDTQWPKFIVFDQQSEGRPAFYVGSVHAPDAEMALLNARDVFARRDDHVRLWVVPESEIFALTLEEISQGVIEERAFPPFDNRITFFVFQKTSHRGTLIQMGEVMAVNPVEAMKNAFEKFANPQAVVWWVLPAHAIHQTDPADNEVLFGPAHSKPFRHSNFYPTVTLMREINLANEKLNWDEE